MGGKAKLNRVEDTKAEELSDAVSKNDYHNEGYSNVEEQPIITITYNNKDYTITVNIEKEYYYKTEDSSYDFPGHEDIRLRNITLESPEITITNEFGTEFQFTSSQIGADNFKNFGKSLMRYIQ